MRWWGWGEEGHVVALPEAAESLLRSELGADPAARFAPVELDEVRLPEPSTPAAVRDRLTDLLGAAHVRSDRTARVNHAGGRSYVDLVRLRSGDGSGAPDLVGLPGSAAEVRAVLETCAEARVAVVPFGGGTTVVGGVAAGAGAISLDLRRLDHVGAVDRVSLTATLGAGLFGPAVERRLEGEGLTLGHSPQSFEHSTVGGWVATRSAGQASTGYGRIDELVAGVRLVAPAGELVARAVPASAAGPDLRQLVLGSEGVLGVISEATLRVRPLPEIRRYEGWSFRSFAEGSETMRAVLQAECAPDVARLSDEEETRLTLALAAPGRLGEAYLRMRGRERGCVAIVGFEGHADEVERRRRRATALLREGGGLGLGRGPGEAWRAHRYDGPYLRDELLDRGVLVETLETAGLWSELPGLYAAVRDALRGALQARGTPPLVMCHLSHLYRSGASLYFTVLARQDPEAPIDQWRAAKAAASEAIVARGATITHHHAIGREHAPWMATEVGPLGLDVLRAAKEALDPEGIMNPGKLLPEG